MMICTQCGHEKENDSYKTCEHCREMHRESYRRKVEYCKSATSAHAVEMNCTARISCALIVGRK